MYKAEGGERIDKLERMMMDLCLNSPYYGASVWGHSRGTQQTAEWLARLLGGDVTVCSISGLTHDAGSVTNGRDGHHRVGARMIKSIMSEMGYPRSVIYQVQYCNYSHRGSKNIRRGTLEARIVATADAINHFDRIEELWRAGRRDRHLGADETLLWLGEKLEKDWNKIMPEVRDLVAENYIRAWIFLRRLYIQDPQY